jgi:hypothetical protein
MHPLRPRLLTMWLPAQPHHRSLNPNPSLVSVPTQEMTESLMPYCNSSGDG